MTKRFQKAFIAIVLVLCMVLPVLSPVAYAAGEAGTGELKDYHSMTMEEILALDEDLTWVVTGDSITHNTSFTQGMNSYTEWFEKYLNITGRSGDTMINTAWGGAVIQDFLYDEDTPNSWNGAYGDPGKGLEQFITRHNPDIITIKLGMNNRSTGDATFLKYYNLMLDSIYAEGKKNGKIPKVIIISPTPLSGESEMNQDQTNLDSVWRFQKMLKELAEERDLIFVDFQSAFTSKVTEWGADEFRATFFSDSASDGGVHPNAAGQYYMFQTFSKALGVYDEDLPIFNIDYKDIVYASLWDERTTDIDLGYAPDVELNTDEDKSQMNGTMPAAPSGTDLLSYIDFTDTNGYFDGTGSNVIDLTDAALGEGALTFAEAQSLGKSFSVVFRAKLGYGNEVNSGLFMISADGLSKWDTSLTLGVPSKTHQIWYKLSQSGADKNDPTHQIPLTGMNIANDGQWHTVAISVSESALNYYVDGTLVDSMDMSASIDIGSLFTNASTYAARFGKYSDGNVQSYSSLKGNFDYWQFYSGVLSEDQVKTLAGNDSAGVEASTWLQAYAENNLWAVAGADQMFGYQGLYVNRSLFHLMECAIRATGNQPMHYRDIRLMTAGAAGYTIDDMAERLSQKDFQVLLLLPEVNQVYAENYVHSAEQVANYKASVQKLLAQYKDKVRILWTPLADDDATINGYLNDYADAVREIAAEDSTILFWDANAFMNQNMQSNPALVDNWFDDDMYITPLAATDLGRGFFTTVQNNGVPIMTLNELSNHNLRENSDNRYLKSDILRDNIASQVTVSGTTVSLDLSAIVNAGYDLSDVQFKVVPSVGYATANEDAYVIPNVSINGNVYSFEAPCSNPVIAIYADGHRFQDMEIQVTTSATIPGYVAPTATDLTELKVVGAKDFGFSADKTAYEIELYQYQSHVQIIGTAADGQTITVNGEEVLSGKRSSMIEVGDGTTVTVKANGKTYTLKLTRPEYPDIIITEVLQDSTGQKYDMLEIYNASGKDLDLKDYSIGIKKDYTYTMPDSSEDQYPYYFLGNSTAFGSTGSGAVSQTGINPITKYSTYEPGYDAANEPDSIPFPADSTMVIWVRYSTSGTATYQDLIDHLTNLADGADYDNKTLNLNGTPVVPGVDQLVVAEIPKGVSNVGLGKDTDAQYGYLENHNAFDDDDNVNGRTWLFLLDKDAQRHYYTGITAAGDDIYSAAMMSRVSTSLNLSTVLYYSVERGMSVVLDAGLFRAAPATGYTSDKSGYMNLTTFGAIEYWQKPLDLADTVKPEVKDNSKDGTISLTFKDDTDIRFMVICIDTDGDGEYDEVIKTDYVLESSAASATGTPEVKAERTYELKDLPKDVKYYGYVLDDNNNKTTFGNGDPVDDLLDSFSKDNQEDTADGATGSAGNTGATGDNTTGGSNTGSTGSEEGNTGNTDATEGTTGAADSNGGTAGGNTTGGSTSSSVSGNTGTNEGSPATGTAVWQTLLVTTIVLISAAIIAVMAVIGYKYKKLSGK